METANPSIYPNGFVRAQNGSIWKHILGFYQLENALNYQQNLWFTRLYPFTVTNALIYYTVDSQFNGTLANRTLNQVVVKSKVANIDCF